MTIQFKAGKVRRNTQKCDPRVREFTRKLSGVLENTDYQGKIDRKNANHVKSNFNSALLTKLRATGWIYEKKPCIHSSKSDIWKADFMAAHEDKPNFKVVLLIVGGGKGYLWLHFLKIWEYINAKRAHAGVILCPTNTTHDLEVVDRFEEARHCKTTIMRTEPKFPLKRIGLLGFTQYVGSEDRYRPMNLNVII